MSTKQICDNCGAISPYQSGGFGWIYFAADGLNWLGLKAKHGRFHYHFCSVDCLIELLEALKSNHIKAGG